MEERTFKMNSKKLKELLYKAYEDGANELEKHRFEDWVKEVLEDLK